MNRSRDKNLTQSIVDELGFSIVKGDYENRNFPNEAALSEQFSASRNIIREVVKILSEKGLLRSRPRHGTSVRPENEWNVLDADVLDWFLGRKMSVDLLKDFFEVRMQIEPAAAALAASRAGEAEKQKLREAMSEMEAAEMGDGDPLDADIAFHAALLEASGNRFYMRLTSLTETALRFSIRITNPQKNVKVHLKSHRDIVRAIDRGDPDLARKKTQALLSTVGKIIDNKAKAASK